MISSARPSVYLGSFVVGEVPPPLDYQFLDANGDPIDLTGFATAVFHRGAYDLGQFVDPVAEMALITDAVSGVVTFAWDGDELNAPGEYAGVFYVNDGTTQYASILITWQVCLGIGTPPAV